VESVDSEVNQLVPDNSPDHPEIDERFEVLELIGQGGMGLVYKVRNKSSDKVFAVKVLRQEFGQDELSVKRFEQEAAAASDLTHANLVSVYDHSFTTSGAPYLVMDYIEGKSLESILKTEVYLDTPRALNLFIQCCEALIHAHTKGVIHRDLKPSNIIVSTSAGGNDIVKIVDFGIAKLLDQKSDTSDFTRTGEFLGTALYISPEQCQNAKADVRSDIYSLGCVMYEALTGRPPFVGRNPVKTILKHLQEEPKPINSVFGDLKVPDLLGDIVLKCLEKDPAERYQTAQDLFQDLESLQAGRNPSICKKEAKWWPHPLNLHYVPPSGLHLGFIVLFALVTIAALPWLAGQPLLPSIATPVMAQEAIARFLASYPMLFPLFTAVVFPVQVGLSLICLPLSLLGKGQFIRPLVFFLLVAHGLLALPKLLRRVHRRKNINAGDYWLLLFHLSVLLTVIVLALLDFCFEGPFNIFQPCPYMMSPFAFIDLVLNNLPNWAACVVLTLTTICSPTLFGLIWVIRRNSKAKPASGW
jgi:tRNA A-37 threonylcarbamoyl transferase component Bud32